MYVYTVHVHVHVHTGCSWLANIFSHSSNYLTLLSSIHSVILSFFLSSFLPFFLLFLSFFARPFSAKNPFIAKIRVNRELHTGGDRSCMHIEMDITGSNMSYVAGDHVAIYPRNNPEYVERIGELLGAQLDTMFSLINTDGAWGHKYTTLIRTLGLAVWNCCRGGQG